MRTQMIRLNIFEVHHMNRVQTTMKILCVKLPQQQRQTQRIVKF